MAHIALKVLWSETRNPNDRYKKRCDDCRNIPNLKRPMVDWRCVLAYRGNMKHPPRIWSYHVHPENPTTDPCWEMNFFNTREVGVSGKVLKNPMFNVGDIAVVITENRLHPSPIPRYPIVAIGKIAAITAYTPTQACSHGSAAPLTMIKLDPLKELLNQGIDFSLFHPYWSGRPLYRGINDVVLQQILAHTGIKLDDC